MRIFNQFFYVLRVKISYTDEYSNAQTETLPSSKGGAMVWLFSATKDYQIGRYTIDAQQGFPITVSVILSTGGGTVLYDAGAKITQ